jgi:predicted chitinase
MVYLPPPNVKLGLELIVSATGAPEANVLRYWPEVWQALEDAGIGQKLVQIGAVATIATEVWSFKPVLERASGEAYEGRADLGNIHAGDGVRYKGRGFIQLTGRNNYRAAGKALGLELEANPDLALQADTAARVFVWYFKNRGVDKACLNYEWRKVRKLVNGGYNGWDRFSEVIRKLMT